MGANQNGAVSDFSRFTADHEVGSACLTTLILEYDNAYLAVLLFP